MIFFLKSQRILFILKFEFIFKYYFAILYKPQMTAIFFTIDYQSLFFFLLFFSLKFIIKYYTYSDHFFFEKCFHKDISSNILFFEYIKVKLALRYSVKKNPLCMLTEYCKYTVSCVIALL